MGINNATFVALGTPAVPAVTRRNVKSVCAALVFAAGIAFGISGSANAGTAVCPSSGTPLFSVETSTSPTCFQFAANDPNQSDLVLPPGYTLLDKTDDNVAGPLSITGEGESSGTFTISGITGDFILKIKDGASSPGQVPWAAFLLDGALSGTWAILFGGGLSHAELFGLATAIPLPPALILFGTALVGMTVLGRRRARRVGQMTP
jgi:hypothetical protein